MREIGLQIANVASRDLLIGPEELERLRETLQVEFISANVLVHGEPLLRPYVVLQKKIGGRAINIGVTGVTWKSRSVLESWPDSLGLEFADPMQAAREMLEVLRPQTDVRILLAHMPLQALEDL
ncbi:MAG: hypothetical protein ACE5G2_08145, partial [Candidatus Krumholzibacteriia bacterium]